MLEDVGYSFADIQSRAWLQESARGVECRSCLLYVLALVYDFEFVNAVDSPRSVLWRACHPVYFGRCRQAAVCLDLYVESLGFEEPEKVAVELEQWLATGGNKVAGRVLGTGVGDFGSGHRPAMVVVGVAEAAIAVASGKTEKYCRCAGVISLALKGIEYFVDDIKLSLAHKMQCCLRFLVRRHGSSYRHCRKSSVLYSRQLG